LFGQLDGVSRKLLTSSIMETLPLSLFIICPCSPTGSGNRLINFLRFPSMKYTKQILENAVKKSSCYADVLRELNIKISGGMHLHIKNRIKYFNICVDHFKKSNEFLQRKAYRTKMLTSKEILVRNRINSRKDKRHLLIRAMLEMGIKEECSKCGIKDWNNEFLNLHIDHINGDWTDNTLNNLRFLCPNCHSQTPTYAIAKIKNII
jgi:hypothetical protein